MSLYPEVILGTDAARVIRSDSGETMSRVGTDQMMGVYPLSSTTQYIFEEIHWMRNSVLDIAFRADRGP